MKTKKDNNNFEKQNSQVFFNNKKLTKKEILSKTKLEFYNQIKQYQKQFKPTKEIEGFGSNAIVGEKNYPQLKVYNISNEEKNNSFLNTQKIVKKNYSDIIKLKAKNVLGNTNNIYVKKTNSKILEEVKNIYKAKKEVEFTSKFDKELKFNKPIINKLSGVLGTKNELKKINLNENAKTSKQIEKYSTNDAKSKEAVIKLYKRKINESQIINLLSLGNFGVQLNKKIVPSRWAITAYDKIIETYLYKKILTYKIINKYEIYHHKDKGNEFIIILIPDTFTFENYEFTPQGWQAIDYVSINNRLGYTDPNTAGGFFASKVATFEHLKKTKKQASIIVLRQIDNYEIPLGVVFVRESIREAMKNKIFSCQTKKELEKYLNKFHKNHANKFKTSKTLKEIKKQKKLREYF